MLDNVEFDFWQGQNLSSRNAHSGAGAHPVTYSFGTRAVYCGWSGDDKVAGTQTW